MTDPRRIKPTKRQKAVEHREIGRLIPGDLVWMPLKGGRKQELSVASTRRITRGRYAGWVEIKMQATGDEKLWISKRQPQEQVQYGGRSTEAFADASNEWAELERRRREAAAKRDDKRYKIKQELKPAPGLIAHIKFREGVRKYQIMKVTPASVYIPRTPKVVDAQRGYRDNAKLQTGDDERRWRRIDLRFVTDVSAPEKELPFKMDKESAGYKKVIEDGVYHFQFGSEFIERSYIVATDIHVALNRRYDYECPSAVVWYDPATELYWRGTGSSD